MGGEIRSVRHKGALVRNENLPLLIQLRQAASVRLNSPLVPISSSAVRATAFGAVFVANVRAAWTVEEEIMKEDAMVENEKVSNIVVTVLVPSRRCMREGGIARQ